jgi:predicted  nucleic acid-binding Zn-ribbon protein
VLFEQKQNLVAKMSQKILAFYDKIRRWAKNTAVVPVRKQACMGCFMRINDKTYAEVIKGEEITTCPHCGRILYLEPQKEEENAE